MKEEKIESFLNGELSAARGSAFVESLRQDEELLREVISQKKLDEALKVMLGDSSRSSDYQSKQAFSHCVMARLRSEGAGEEQSKFSRSVLTEILEEREGAKPKRWKDWLKAGAVAMVASVAIFFFLQTIVFPRLRMKSAFFANLIGQAEVSNGLIARVHVDPDTKWKKEADPVREDGWLGHRLIELESGTAKIVFNSGASALLEGPASLSVETSNRAFLQYGKLTAEVPPQASGFAVSTPRMNVVDIGTRFGISVDQGGNSEVHVMQGEVEASRSSGNSATMVVREGVSLRADSRTRSQLEVIPYAGDQFVSGLKRHDSPKKSRASLQYLFDESSDRELLQNSGKMKNGETSLLAIVLEGLEAPHRSVGFQGGGLAFAAGQELPIAVPKKFHLNRAHTVQFRIKIPPRLGLVPTQEVLRFGEQSGDFWRVLCNQELRRGVRGAIRLEFGKEGYLMGSTDLADGKWHHVAIRFAGGENEDAASQVNVFIDGVVENLRGWSDVKFSNNSVKIMQLGGGEKSGFHGWLDDLEVYREALDTTVIQEIASGTRSGGQ